VRDVRFSLGDQGIERSEVGQSKGEAGRIVRDSVDQSAQAGLSLANRE
jgi:hypothetical protein